MGHVRTKRRQVRRLGLAADLALPRDRLVALLETAPEEAVPLITAAARHGQVEAQVLLGQLLLDGRGTSRDPAAAVGWLMLAADTGNATAMNLLGRCHECGWGVAADDIMAVHWYSRAAEHGLDVGLYNLATMRLNGRGAAADRGKAFFLFLRAAHLGHARSMDMIGRFFEEGWEVARDLGAALDWYRRAAKAGDFRGQYHFGMLLLRKGRIAEAAAWLGASVRGGEREFLRSVAETLLRSEHVSIRAVGELAVARLGGAMQAAPPASRSALRGKVARALPPPPRDGGQPVATL